MDFILFFRHLVFKGILFYYLLNSLEICMSCSTVSQKSKSLRLRLRLDFSFHSHLLCEWTADLFIRFVYLPSYLMILLRDLFCLIVSVSLRQWTRTHGGKASEVQWGVTLKWFIMPMGSAAMVCPKSAVKGAFLLSMALLRIDGCLSSRSHLFCFRCTHTHTHTPGHLMQSGGRL